MFSREGVVSTSPNPQAGGPPLIGCPLLLIQFIHSYPPYRRPFLHPQPEDAPCRGDRDPHSWEANASHLQKMWAEVSYSASHLHKGPLVSPSKWRCLLKAVWPIRRPITALDVVLLKDKNLVFVVRLGPETWFQTCHWVLLGPRRRGRS
jgi:hypothetical protein